MNGSLHQRYPFNYDRFDEPKEKVGMSGAEYQSYMETTITIPSTPRVREVWESVIPDSAIDCDTPRGGQIESASPTPRIRTQNRDFCANRKCAEIRQEAARLRGDLFDIQSQLLSSQADIKEYETTEKLRRNALGDAEYELEKEKERADAAENECMLRMETNIKLLQRMRELEMKAKQVDNFEAYCTRLEAKIKELKGGREAEKRGCDSLLDSENGDKPRKRMRLSNAE
jgi:hypothetical protein